MPTQTTFLEPAETSDDPVRAAEIGQSLVEMLVERIENPECPPQTRRFETALVERDSLGPPPGAEDNGLSIPSRDVQPILSQ
jgi:DNA-binding LacI/PurR family transcriptional regulator